jgi:3-keto-disaccharide hydrolase
MIKRLSLAVLVLALGTFSGQAFADEWKQLFNGKDLTGWEHVGPGGMTVEDSLIKTHGGMGLLYYTGGKIGNAVIRVVYKMRDKNDNSGVFIRIPIPPREAWMPVHYGYEVQIDDDPEASGEDDAHATGCLYSIDKALARPGKGSGQWNTMEITLNGPHTVVLVNGAKVTDYTEGDPVPPRKFDFEPLRGPRPNEGYIGLQNHSDKDVVFFKEVAVRPLN